MVNSNKTFIRSTQLKDMGEIDKHDITTNYLSIQQVIKEQG